VFLKFRQTSGWTQPARIAAYVVCQSFPSGEIIPAQGHDHTRLLSFIPRCLVDKTTHACFTFRSFTGKQWNKYL